MNDAEFLTAFERATLHEFPHRDHIRMAWLYLRNATWEDGCARICSGLRRLTSAHGAPGKYHETMTRFWARIVRHAIEAVPDIRDFDAFIAQHPRLLDRRLIEQHYSPGLLNGEAARRTWVEPDLLPMP